MNIKKLIILGLVLFVSCRRSTYNPDNNPPVPQPRNISRTDSTQSYGPWIAIGHDGTVYVAWMDGGRTRYNLSRIYFRYKPPGGEWSDIEILSDSLHDAWAPVIVADPFGNVHLVWYANTVGHNDFKIYYRMRDPSGVWSLPMVLSGEEQADQPRIAADPSGTIHVIWNERSFKYRRKFPNGTWSEIESGPVSATNPSIAVDSNGGVHLVCESEHNNIYYLYRSPTGTWNGPVNLSNSSWHSWYVFISLDDSGNPWVLWTEQDYGAGWNTGIIYYSRRADSTWTVPDSIPGTRAGHSWPRNKRLFFYKGCEYLLWGDGFYDIFLGKTDGELEDGLTVVKPFVPPNSPYPEALLDKNGVLHVVWAADRGDGNWDIFYDTINLNRR